MSICFATLLARQGFEAVVCQLDILVAVHLQDVAAPFVNDKAPHHVLPVKLQLFQDLHGIFTTLQDVLSSDSTALPGKG